MDAQGLSAVGGGERYMGAPAVALRTVEHRGAKVSVQYRHDDLEVMTIEIGAHGALESSALGGRAAWHLVVDGEAVFRQEGQPQEVLREQSVSISGLAPYTILNPSPQRLRLLSVVLTDDEG